MPGRLRIVLWVERGGGRWCPVLELFWWRGGSVPGWVGCESGTHGLETIGVLSLSGSFAVKGKRERESQMKGSVGPEGATFRDTAGHVSV